MFYEQQTLHLGSASPASFGGRALPPTWLYRADGGAKSFVAAAVEPVEAGVSEVLGPWLWFAGEEPEVSRDGLGMYDLAEERTRDEVVAAARKVRTGGVLHIIEARCFHYRERGEAEDGPLRFAETRNHEIVED